MALLSVSLAIPLDAEKPADIDKDAVIDVNAAEPAPIDEVTLKPEDLELEVSNTGIGEESANLGGSFIIYFECFDGRYPVDPYFNPYFRLQMQDPLYRRWLKQRKCKLFYY